MIEILKGADLLLFFIALLAIIFAVVTDIKKREVPNWLNFSLLATALTIRAIVALLTSQASYFLYALIAIAVFFVLANIFFYTKIFGGGDCKLLVALAVVFATKPYFASSNIISFFNEPFLSTFLINSLFFGAVFGIIASVFSFITLKNKKKFFSDFASIEKNLGFMKIVCFIFALIFLITAFILGEWIFMFIVVSLAILPFLYAFLKAIEKDCFVRLTPWEKLSEGDLLFKEVKVGKDGKKTIKQTAEGLSHADIALLKKIDKKVLIVRGLPFVPLFLIALLVSLFYGNLLSWVISLLI